MTIREEITVNDVIDFLNEACEADPKAMKKLISHYVDCNKKLATHERIHAQSLIPLNDDGSEDSNNTLYFVQFLDILNGLFAFDTQCGEKIGAMVEVVCQSCGAVDNSGKKFGEKCSECGGNLISGKLLYFGKQKIK